MKMKLKPGWQLWRFDQMAEMINERIDDPTKAGVERYVGLEHLDPESLKIRRWGDPSDVKATKLFFRKGDIIFGRRRAYQRKLAVADFEGICSAHAMVLRAKPGVVLPELLPFFMQSDIFMNRAVEISVGSLSPTINWKTLAMEEFALPPIEEQHKITYNLSTLENTIATFNQLNQSCYQLKKSLLNHLLSPKKTWEKTIVGEVAQVIGGGTPNTKIMEYWNGNIPWLTPTEIVKANREVIMNSERKISEEGLNNSSANLLPSGAILLTSRASIGAVAIAGCELATNQGFQSLIPKNKVSSEYLFYWCQYSAPKMVALASGSTFLEISNKTIRNMTIFLPPEEMQREIIEKLIKTDHALSTFKIRLNSLLRIKELLFNKYLGGDY